MKEELVSVTIPTLNSARTLTATLDSVVHQTYNRIELIIADGNSRDETSQIAAEFGAKIIQTRGRLLGARFDAYCRATGKYVLLLDSDQILRRSAVERCVSMMQDYDMVALEEFTSAPRTYVQRLFQADRVLINRIGAPQLDVGTGTMLPRFFKAGLLGIAFSRIPRSMFGNVIAHDHAIIYLEATKVSRRVGVVSEAIYSQEPSGLVELWSKNFRYGRSTIPLMRTPYWGYVWRKSRLRTGRQGLHGSSFSDLLLVLKSFPYMVGLGVGGMMDIGRHLSGRDGL